MTKLERRMMVLLFALACFFAAGNFWWWLKAENPWSLFTAIACASAAGYCAWSVIRSPSDRR